LLLLLGAALVPAALRAEEPAGDPILPPGLNLLGPGAGTPSPSERAGRFRLFRMQPGFLRDPVGLDSDDASPEPAGSDSVDWVSVAMGNDNPYFDFRKRGDPGGFGYMRVNSQVQLFDTSRTACSIALQAYTPAGLDFDGLPDRMGPTVVMPAFSLFHELEDGTAVHAYVGKNWMVQNPVRTTAISKDVQYGMALQRPLVKNQSDFLGDLYVSVGALGQYRADVPVRNMEWDLLPGLHWKVADNWWVSGGVMVPMNALRTGGVEAVQQWQVTCSVQF